MVNSLKPFFTFYGGKWRAAPHYPAPIFSTIVEPFAGSAGYSMRYPERNVILVERDPLIAATWRYLLRVSPAEILALPDIRMDQTVADLPVCEEARLLIGWWLKGGSRRPVHRATGWMRKAAVPGYKNGGPKCWWGSAIRERIASQVESIRHWTLVEGDYTEAPDVAATWFVDPPYDNAAGEHYVFGRRSIDYADLAGWCRGRQGQVLVCEQVGAAWLPFVSWRSIRSATNGGARVSREALWARGEVHHERFAQPQECGPQRFPRQAKEGDREVLRREEVLLSTRVLPGVPVGSRAPTRSTKQYSPYQRAQVVLRLPQRTSRDPAVAGSEGDPVRLRADG